MAEKLLLVKLLASDTAVVQRIIAVVDRVLHERCGARVVQDGDVGYPLTLKIAADIGSEGYRIEDSPTGGIIITGNDEVGLLFGAGKFLHDAKYGENEFTAGDWRGCSLPQHPFRAIYFATHFHNFYHEAPLEEIEHYIEELALWGYNGLSAWFDMHHFNGIAEPAAQEFIIRIKTMLACMKSLGLKAGIMVLANEAYANSPEHLRANWQIEETGYLEPLSHYHLEVCPSNPEGRQYILQNLKEEFTHFADMELDFITIWPYDQGGCTCEKCKPWGGNGFVKIAREIADLFRSFFPRSKVILSTWLFERYIKGEFAALDKALTPNCTWADYLMLQMMYIEPVPEYPLKHGAPGGLTLLDFPEISMCGHGPWGGFGCNPFGNKLRPNWDEAKGILAGGLPYSEGIYEDINKVVYARFYWDDAPVSQTIREYASFYFGSENADTAVQIIALMEASHVHELAENQTLVNMPERAGAEMEWPLVQQIEKRMTSYARKEWRWRLVYLRAMIDAELTANQCNLTDRCYQAFAELTKIYHAEHGQPGIKPPSRESQVDWQKIWDDGK